MMTKCIHPEIRCVACDELQQDLIDRALTAEDKMREAYHSGVESLADKINAAMASLGYEEQEGDEAEEDIVRSLVAFHKKTLESGHVVVENIDWKSRAESAEAALAEERRLARIDGEALRGADLAVERAEKERDEARAEVEHLQSIMVAKGYDRLKVRGEAQRVKDENARLTSLLAATREALNDTDLISSERVAKALALTPAKPTEDDNG